MSSKEFCFHCQKLTSQILVLTNYDQVSQLNFDISKCEACGTISTNFDYPADRLKDFYPENYRNYSGIEQLVQKTVYWYLIRKWLSRYTPKSVFEIGFGRGEMLSLCKEQGVWATGCEMTQFHVDRLREAENIEAYVNLENVPDKKYDLLVFYNSLEHLIEIDKYLIFSKKHLNQDGTIIVTVPNFQSKQSQVLKGRWVHLDTPRHLTHFTEDSLRNLMSKYDLELSLLKKGNIVYDLYGWKEGFMHSSKNRNIFTMITIGLFSLVTTLIARLFGDYALIEAHFQHGKSKT